MQMLAKTNLSLTIKSKEELLSFPIHSKTRQLVMLMKISLFLSNTQILQNNFFQKRFLKFYKALKTIEKPNLEIYKL